MVLVVNFVPITVCFIIFIVLVKIFVLRKMKHLQLVFICMKNWRLCVGFGVKCVLGEVLKVLLCALYMLCAVIPVMFLFMGYCYFTCRALSIRKIMFPGHP